MKTLRRIPYFFLPLLIAVSCFPFGRTLVDLTVAPTEVPRDATTQLLLTTSEDMGAGDPEVAIFPSSGITITNTQKLSGTTVSVDVTVAADAVLGSRIVRLLTDDVIGAASVTVVEAVPPPEAVFTCDPASVEQGDSATIAVLGTDAHFDSTSVISLADSAVTGITLGTFAAADATHGTFGITVAEDATLGAAQLQIVTGAETATGSIFIDQYIPEPTPSIVADPDSMMAGTSGLVTITGTNTHFSGESTVWLGDGVVVTDLVFSEPLGVQTLSATIEVDGGAETGSRILRVTSPYGSGFENVETEFEILEGPSLTVTPSEGDQGEVVPVILTGTNTNFDTDGSLVLIEHATDPGASGVQIDVTNIAPPGIIEAYITIDEEATVGSWVISVTTGSEVVSAEFLVNDVEFIPSLVASPSEGDAGEELEVVLTGTNTHFVDSTTTLTSVSTDIDIVGYVVDDDTQTITATIDIATGADDQLTYLTAATGSEEVSAAFTIHAIGVCNTITIDPGALSIGRFGTVIILEQEGSDWVVGESAVSIVDDPEHIWFGNATDSATERCYVSTGSHITCSTTVGVFATPGEYEVEVTTGEETLCGLLTITDDDLEAGTVPGEGLPAYNGITGTIDPGAGDRSDFYSVNVEAGDAIVFHAFSLDRETLDPVLRLIDPGGDDWLVYEDDETSLGLDSRIVYWFAEGGTYIVEVGPKSDTYLGTGSYTLYTYLLTHGNTVVEVGEEEDPDGGVDGGVDAGGGSNIFAAAQDLGSVEAIAVYGTLTGTADVDVFRIDAAAPMALDVVARRLGDYDGSLADAALAVYATGDTDTILTQNGTWNEVPGTDDPRVFLDSAGSYYVVISPQAAPGMYVLNARPLVVINEVDNRSTSTAPFVELVGPPSFDLGDYSLCTYDSDGVPVDGANECLSLTEITTSSSGYRALFASDFSSSTTLALPSGAGAVVLRRAGETVDAVQYGELTSGTFAEGDAAEVGDRRVIGRGGEVDTNDNKMDFIYMASPTPDAPNDRTCQAPVPLYGEPPG